MLEAKYGEIIALITAVCWSFTAMSFEAAGKKVGSLSVNLLRLLMAVFLFMGYNWIVRGFPFPSDATLHNWTWLLLSGFIGFCLGDLCLFQAFVIIGARMSMLIMSLVPPLTAVLGWMVMGETLTGLGILGMIMTITGVVLVVLERNPDKRISNFKHPVTGVLLGLGGAIGQAIGLVLSKYGMGSYNAFAATQIRIFAGIFGFFLIFTLMKRWKKFFITFTHKRAMSLISLGAVFGPFLGVAFSLLAIQHTETGVASTIMALVPVLIIPLAILFFKEKVTSREILGAVVAVMGVGVLFL
jgi:drug/metabolite transporter (DMT)-like permease